MRFVTDLGEGLRISFRALLSNKLRAVLTTLGILIGVTTVVLMVTIILGLNRSVANQLSFLGSNTVYVSRWDWFGDNWRAMLKRPRLKPEIADQLVQMSTLAEAVSPIAETSRSVAFRSSRLTRVSVMGVTEGYLVTNSAKIDLGRFFTDEEVRRNRQVVVIGSEVANRLFEQTGPLDQRIDIGGQKFRVVGVNAKMGRFLGQNMDEFVLIPFGTFEKRFARNLDTEIVVKAHSAEQVEDLEWELRGIMRRLRKLGPLDADNFGINNQSMIMNLYRQLTGTIYAGGVIIAAISLLVGGIGIMNIMLVSVTERTSEIGLRKALGARRWMVAWQFLIESAIICSLGGVAGAGLAYAGSKAMNSFIPTSMPLWVVGLAIAFSATIGVFFGLYPSMKAARLSPIEALRQE
ncbi:FtsX-like permease family protein [candidate division KSB1 bacterium]|nr:MAG: FtsX-like permease family protein [candidate division KSB1 bacterium]